MSLDDYDILQGIIDSLKNVRDSEFCDPGPEYGMEKWRREILRRSVSLLSGIADRSEEKEGDLGK